MKIFACALILFALNPCFAGQTAPAVKTVYSFTGKGKDVPLLHARLIQGKDGNFYGVSNVRGAGNFGTIFKITPAGVRTTLHAFTRNGADGAEPCDGLVADSHSNFYGTTGYGGSSGSGTVFKITPKGRFSALHSFTGIGFAGGSADGALPHAGLVRGRDGNFYGTTWSGGRSGDGTVFKITPAGALRTLHSFTGSNAEGAFPYAGLTPGGDGNFYGTTTLGGRMGGGVGGGTVFRISQAGVLMTLHSFKDGAYLYAGLVQGDDGNFYGETAFGGKMDGGTVFQITPAGVLTTLRSFSRYGAGGSALIDDLAKGSDGSIYATTLSGGRHGKGTIFRIIIEGLNRS
jgi:uncharacterized repeat protein (TIGR03803 family)